MNRLLKHSFLITGIVFLLISCSNKSSNEACIHQVAMDLDAGRYDSVLASACADAMQQGAAYFGKAGFDMKDVVDQLIQSGIVTDSSSTQTDLKAYMTSLIGSVTGTTLTSLNNSANQYAGIPTNSDLYDDAQFNLSVVEALKSLSLMKIVMTDETGTLNTNCDINNNNVADGADAASCALIAATNISTNPTPSLICNNASYSRSNPIDITFVSSGQKGIYSGLTITLTGTATADCPSQFKKLLYKDSLGKYWVATTSADEQCLGSDGNSWPCPIEQNDQPLDLVTAIDTSLNTSVSSLNTSLTISTSSDVSTAIQNLQKQACPTGTCSSTDISAYLQTLQ